MSVVDKVQDLITPALESLGLWVVRVSLIGGAEMPTLQIMVDRINDTAVDIEDCTEASRAISALMDVEDPIQSKYDLEVSTPGIDRPLVRPQDWIKYIGHTAKCELRVANALGRRRFKGQIVKFEDTNVTLDVDNEHFDIDINELETAKLVLTDALMAFCQKEIKAINKKTGE